MSGCTNFKRSAFTDHQTTRGHKDALLKNRKSKSKPGETPAEKCIESLNRATFDRLSILFRNAHAIAMNSRPFRDFIWQAELDERKGLIVGKTYRNDKQCKQFVKAIAYVERNKIEQELKRAKFLSVLSDGSVDISVIDCKKLSPFQCSV